MPGLIQRMKTEALHRPSERAQSFTELALSLVFILILLAGVVDLGRMFWVFVTLRDAAQEGAAYASFCPAHISGIQSRIRNSSSNPVDLTDTTNIKIIIAPDCSFLSCSVGDAITITVSNPTFKMSMPFLGGVTIPLSAEVNDTILSTTQTCPP